MRNQVYRRYLLPHLTCLIAAVALAAGCDVGAREGSWSNPGAVSYGTSGPCVDGNTRACTVPLAVHNGVQHCFAGEQVCVDGTWTPCAEPEQEETMRGMSASQPMSLGGATQCDDNPCVPTCQQFNEQPQGGVAPDAELVGTVFSGSIDSIPPGFIGKGIIEPCSSMQDCQFDHYCDSNTGQCVPFQPGETVPVDECQEFDLTVGVPCTGYLPVCNRGNTDAPAGVIVHIHPGNSSHFPDCTPDVEDRKGTCVVAAAIPAGHCVNITEADCEPYGNQGNVLSGNKTAMVNPPVGQELGELEECFCENNWSDYHSGACQELDIYRYEPMVYTQVYEADCPHGTEIQWGLFTYEADTPEDSNIVFQVHSGHCIDSLGELVTANTARSFPADTQSCSKLGPNPCPIDLYELLGEPDANKRVLELVVTLNPNSMGTLPATLNSWEVTYACIENV